MAALNTNLGIVKHIASLPVILGCENRSLNLSISKNVGYVCSDAERIEFINCIANNPDVGGVMPGSVGCWKVRWSYADQDKRDGARVIYFNTTDAAIWLLIVHKKTKFDNLPTAFLAELTKGIEDGL
jgi:hypothetical protein